MRSVALSTYVMMGHAVFSDTIDGETGWREKVRNRFESLQFPQDEQLCRGITLRCWQRKYESAQEIIEDIEYLEQLVIQWSDSALGNRYSFFL